jgi:hypothetical protein
MFTWFQQGKPRRRPKREAVDRICPYIRFLLAGKEVKKIYSPKPFQKPDSHTGYR